MADQYATNAKLRGPWGRLALLLIALPREGWEHEFRTITHHKIYRQTLLEENEAGHDEQS